MQNEHSALWFDEILPERFNREERRKNGQRSGYKLPAKLNAKNK